MILTTIDEVPGKRVIEHYGLVTGSTVRSKHFGTDILAGFKNIIGGELKGYTELMEQTRDEAVKRMMQQAQAKGADAVIGIRFSTSDVAPGAAEVFAYGTAVKLVPAAQL
ncbi:MAG: YbjQ family protein [Pseudobdellovibrionaceae bacterium]